MCSGWRWWARKSSSERPFGSITPTVNSLSTSTSMTRSRTVVRRISHASASVLPSRDEKAGPAM